MEIGRKAGKCSFNSRGCIYASRGKKVCLKPPGGYKQASSTIKNLWRLAGEGRRLFFSPFVGFLLANSGKKNKNCSSAGVRDVCYEQARSGGGLESNWRKIPFYLLGDHMLTTLQSAYSSSFSEKLLTNSYEYTTERLKGIPHIWCLAPIISKSAWFSFLPTASF